MKYTQIPTNTFEEIQLNAGILVDTFNPVSGGIGNILGATTGGVTFTDTPTYKDFGEDIDNCPKNMMELKHLDSREVVLSGTFVTLSSATAKTLVGSGDVDPVDSTHIIPRNEILSTDFKTLWWIGDYSSKNTGNSAGFVAIKLLNALNTGGFQIKSEDKGKGQFAFTFTGHYSMAAQDVVPYELYIKAGEDSLAVPVVGAEAPATVLFDTPVSDMQTGVSVSGSAISGTLHFIEGGLAQSGPLAGDGYFLALKFTSDDWSQYTSVKVGLDPSQGTGLVEILTDPDKNGVFKITDNEEQVFKVVAESTEKTSTVTYSLTNLELEEEEP